MASRPPAQTVGRPRNGSGGPANDNNNNNNNNQEIEVTFTAKFCYYTVGFIAYWFGSSRFDMDGDGDFDAADVQQMLNKGGKNLHLNFRRPPQDKEELKKRRLARQKSKLKRQKENQQREKMHQQAMKENAQKGGVGGLVGGVGESLAHGIDEAAGAVEQVAGADVEGEGEEEEIMDNLRQFLPWFTIMEVLICLVLWGVFAGREFPYSLNSVYQPIPDSIVLRTFTEDGTVYKEECAQECNGESECVGYAFREGPFSECKLLKTLPAREISGSIRSDTKCGDATWNWKTYSKDSWDLGVWLGTQGGLENWFPGQTALRSHYYCEEGFAPTFLYRWWTYQFTHGGLSHVGSNSFMTVVLGIPLEGLHGTGMFALMWTTGVLGGALNWALFDPYRTSFGASGGCFSLLGMHVADLVMNWHQKKFRWMLVFMLLFVTGVELAGFWANYSEEGSLTAHTVHVGGLMAGLLIGICTGRNIHVEKWERIVQVVCWVTGILMCLISLIWWFANPFPGIRNAWDLTERPWCWIGQVCIGDNGAACPWDALGSNAAYFTQCVFCETKECVEGWFGSRDADGGFTYCPRSYGWSACHGDFDGSWDLFYPPSKSAFQ